MGGTAPVCPFCKKWCNQGGVKDHIKSKHPDQYKLWLEDGMKPYWMYDENGSLKQIKTGS